MSNTEKVELNFVISGSTIPVDHGYVLFSAISKAVHVFHESQSTALGLIRGRFIGDGLLDISSGSYLTIRLKPEEIPPYINLAGKILDLKGHKLLVGVPRTRAVVPQEAVYAHFVTTRNGQNAVRFLSEIKKQMAALQIHGSVILKKRKTMEIHEKQVVGYETTVEGLSDEDSIRLQASGIGGRRKMGCGFFVPMEKCI
jgi:CRISPR-associated protein Cas6